ncbi:MAG TPA: hypothetical protein PKL23_06650 [Candidatus Egerieousia sp.]|nr:hypothetical protein [Candidatus Egerieousia sp.]
MIIKEGGKFPEAINLTVKSYKIGENLLAIRSALKGSVTDNYNYPELADKEFVLDADALTSGKDLQLPKNHYTLTLSSEWLLLPDTKELQKLNFKEIAVGGRTVLNTDRTAINVGRTVLNTGRTALAIEYKRKTSEEFFFTAVPSGAGSDSKSINTAGNMLIMKYSVGTGKVETNWDSVSKEFRFFFPSSLEIALGYLTSSQPQL